MVLNKSAKAPPVQEVRAEHKEGPVESLRAEAKGTIVEAMNAGKLKEALKKAVR